MADPMEVWRLSAAATMLENVQSTSHYGLSGSDGPYYGLSQGQDSSMGHWWWWRRGEHRGKQ